MKSLTENIKNLAGNKRKSKKWLWAAIAVVVVLAIVGSSMLKSLDVETEAAKNTDVRATVWEKGKVKSRDAVDIYSEVQGKVKEVLVDTGDKVAKGTLLAVLDVSELDSQIARLEGDLKAVEGLSGAGAGSSQLRERRLAVEQANIAQGLAESAYKRVKELFENGAATKVELDQARADVETKRKAVAQAQASLAALTQQNSGQKESLWAQLNYLKSQKGKASIKADRDGLVFTSRVKEGDVVSPGTHLFTIGKTGQVDIETYVNNKDIAYVKQGDKVTVIFKVPGEDVKVPGAITNIAPAAEEIISSLGIAEDKIKVKVNLSETPKSINLTPGMGVDVVITTQEAKGVLAVPKETVFTDNGKEFVWSVRDGRASIIEVVTGLEGDELVEIKKGLKQNEPVLVNPHLPELKEGIKVK